MATVITNEDKKIVIQFPHDHILYVPKPFRVTLKTNRGTIWINQGDNGVVSGRSDIPIKFVDVTSPVAATIGELAELLSVYSTELDSASGTFTNADLVAGVLTISHALGSVNVAIVIRDPAGTESYQPNTVVDNDTVTVDFGGSIGAGTYTWSAITA